MRLVCPKSLSLPDSPLFIYLPGMDGTGELLHRQINKLSCFFRVCCLSIPKDDCSNWNTLVSKTINLIKKELKHYSQASSVYLCGESFGGCLAIKLALKSPELVKKMILINPASSFTQRPLLSWGSELIQWVPDILHQTSTLGFLPFLVALGRIERKDYHTLLKAMQSVPPLVVSYRLRLLRNFNVDEAQLKQLTQPILTVASDSDYLLPSLAEGKRLVTCLPNSHLVVLHGSGHACLLETEVDLTNVLQKYNFLPFKTIAY
ncbi:alpha/beta fold hydrolase [Cyanobacterium sp. uoEpiScrs1]|uniref:alpha/beta fold hydrolase n=1 Tax=Cyanobacterium sp. uoEpiScrs1 TaxID=2976343 RepID=UPI00226AA510|nr:alpha/beta hydrolase [Cyanobacterium sp. uoEpiScrs1]